MKKAKITMVAGALSLVLSACGQKENTEEKRLIIEKIDVAKEVADEVDEVPKTQRADPADPDPKESVEEEQTVIAKSDDEPEEAGDLLYDAFLKNEISVTNPYVEGMNLTVMDDKEYETEFEDAQKKYTYVDVNGDEKPELIFKISSYPSELMYILGICDNELVCFDVFETHTKDIAFGVYDYGFVWKIQNYDGFEMTFYTYTAEGQPTQARCFTQENEADMAAYEGEEPEWIDWSPSLSGGQ